MTLIDTHAHIYSKQLISDLPAILDRADKGGVGQILMPAIDATTHAAMLQVEQQYPGRCISMMGLHPCSVGENYVEELRLVEDFLTKRTFIAVGEIGLDFYWDLTYKDQQVIAFNRQVELALAYDIPIVIHSRNSTEECLEIVKQYQKGKLRGVFHCFSGDRAQAQQVIDLGFYLGIGGVVTFKNGGLDKALEGIPLEYIVLETDAPYLAPVPYRGKRNEPSYIEYVAYKLAELYKIEVETVAAATTSNAKKLFSLTV